MLKEITNSDASCRTRLDFKKSSVSVLRYFVELLKNLELFHIEF